MADTLDPAIVRFHAKIGGFSDADIPTAVAIAFAESGGNPKAHNSTPPDDSYGLWQINMLGDMGPARRKQFGISSNDALFDPTTNAKAAYAIYKGSGWNAWTTYTSGKYKEHLDKGKGGAKLGNTALENAAADTGVSEFTGLQSAINAVGENIFKGVSNVVGIILAIALLVGGIAILISNSKAGKSVLGATKKATIGKVTS
jgi:hypothetical protein